MINDFIYGFTMDRSRWRYGTKTSAAHKSQSQSIYKWNDFIYGFTMDRSIPFHNIQKTVLHVLHLQLPICSYCCIIHYVEREKEESPSSCLIKSRVHIFLSNHYLDSIVLLLFYRLWLMIVDTKKCQKKKETEKFIVVFFISL